MNWEMIGAISEAAGVLAVVATLVYLARNIKQNSKSLEIAALGDITAQWNFWSSMLANSKDLAQVVAKGNWSYSSLSDPEKLRYGAYVQSFFDIVESNRTLVVNHETEKDIKVLESILRSRMEIPGFASWWKENTSDYGEEFKSWVDAFSNDT